MNGACPGIVDTEFLQSVLGFVDCQAQTIGAGGYQALSAPGSTLSLLLTGFLTLFIAFFGYRMLFGDVPGARDGVVALVKIGIVLALATSWPAYRTLVYDVALHAPAELAVNVGGPARLPGSGGGLTERLGQVDNALIELNRLGPGSTSLGTVDAVRTVNGQQVTAEAPLKEPETIFSPFALGTARLVFLTATVAAFAAVRLIAGLLLALGPFFIAFLLFEGTRSLFEGWVRGLVAAVLGALVVTVLLGVELALLEPWLAELISRRQVDQPIGGAPTDMLVITLAFSLALVAGMGVSARMAVAFRLPQAWRNVLAREQARMQSVAGLRQAENARSPLVPSEQHSRAAAVAEAVANTQRREVPLAGAVTGPPSRGLGQTMQRDATVEAPSRLGQSYRRRTQGRVSASASRRDAS